MRPLSRLTLSFALAALLSGRAGAVAAADKAPSLAQQSAAAVKAVCADLPPRCAEFENSLEEIGWFQEDAQAYLKALPRKPDLAGLNPHLAESLRLIQRTQHQYQGVDERLGVLALLVWETHKALAAVSEKWIPEASTSLHASLTALEDRSSRLERASLLYRGPEASTHAASIRSLGQDGIAALDRFQEVSLAIDYSGNPMDDPVLKKRKTANGLAVRLSALRDRLIALEKRAGSGASSRLDFSTLLKPDAKPGPGAWARADATSVKLPPLDAFGAQAAAEAGALMTSAGSSQPLPEASQGQAGLAAADRRSLLQVPKMRVPAPKDEKAGVPDIGLLGRLKLMWARRSGGESELQALRDLGLTRVVGDPKGRAALVHQQDPMTCTIVCQQQMLTASGALEGKDPKAVEHSLLSEAFTKGYLNVDDSDPASLKLLGTPFLFTGNLLKEHGMIVTKTFKASNQDLAQAAGRGGMLLVDVDPGVLRGNKDLLGISHSIVITGAEISRGDGKVLGYFINDSDSVPLSKGEFIPVKQLLDAWHAGNSSIIEAR